MSTTNNINATTIMNEIDGLVRQRGVPIQFEHGWGLIKRALNEIVIPNMNEQPETKIMTNNEFISICRLVFDMCYHNNSQVPLYNTQREWMQNYVQTHIIIPSIEKIRAHQGVTEELQRELNLTLKKFQSMRKLFCKIFRAVDRFYVNRENDSRRMWYYRENHDRVETIEESVTTIFKTSLDEKLQASEIVKYYCDRWLIEQQNDDTSVEEFTFTTKTKVVEERTMLVKEFGFEDALLAQPGAQDGVTSKCILEQLILRGLEHERNNHGDAEVMMNKFEEVFNVYDRIQKGDQNRFRSSFIEASKRYYAQIRAQWIGENKSLDIYMKDTEQLLGVEALRISFYIREERWVEEAIEAAKQELVIDYVNEVINPQHSGGKIDHILLL